MNAYLLVGFLCASLNANPDPLLRELETDFEILINRNEILIWFAALPDYWRKQTIVTGGRTTAKP